MITAATVVIRELFVRLTCDPGALKTSLKLPPLARVERRVNEDFTGAVTRDLFRGKYSFRTLNYVVIPGALTPRGPTSRSKYKLKPISQRIVPLSRVFAKTY